MRLSLVARCTGTAGLAADAQMIIFQLDTNSLRMTRSTALGLGFGFSLLLQVQWDAVGHDQPIFMTYIYPEGFLLLLLQFCLTVLTYGRDKAFAWDGRAEREGKKDTKNGNRRTAEVYYSWDALVSNVSKSPNDVWISLCGTPGYWDGLLEMGRTFSVKLYVRDRGQWESKCE